MTRESRLTGIKFINEYERANAHCLERTTTRRYRDKKFVDAPQKWCWFRYEFLVTLDGVDFGVVIDEYGDIAQLFNRENLEVYQYIGEGTALVIDNEILKSVRTLVDLLEKVTLFN